MEGPKPKSERAKSERAKSERAKSERAKSERGDPDHLFRSRPLFRFKSPLSIAIALSKEVIWIERAELAQLFALSRYVKCLYKAIH
jgi:hypothetical protein